MASRSVVINHAQFVALLDTLDAQRRLLERVILVRQGYQQSLHRDIAAHLEATK